MKRNCIAVIMPKKSDHDQLSDSNKTNIYFFLHLFEINQSAL